jgi:hypothetical protein
MSGAPKGTGSATLLQAEERTCLTAIADRAVDRGRRLSDKHCKASTLRLFECLKKSSSPGCKHVARTRRSIPFLFPRAAYTRARYWAYPTHRHASAEPVLSLSKGWHPSLFPPAPPPAAADRDPSLRWGDGENGEACALPTLTQDSIHILPVCEPRRKQETSDHEDGAPRPTSPPIAIVPARVSATVRNRLPRRRAPAAAKPPFVCLQGRRSGQASSVGGCAPAGRRPLRDAD